MGEGEGRRGGCWSAQIAGAAVYVKDPRWCLYVVYQKERRGLKGRRELLFYTSA